MFRSWINIFLPDDEYKRLRVLYFMAEAVILTTLIFLCLGTLAYFSRHLTVSTEVLLFLTPFLIYMYIFFRYIFSGLEYPDVFQEETYQRKRKQIYRHSVISGALFAAGLLVVNGIPRNLSEGLDLIMPAIFFFIFYFIISTISLKRSMKKNEQLEDWLKSTYFIAMAKRV